METAQREKTYLGKADTLGPQPGRDELYENVQRQTGSEPGKDADQHAPVENGFLKGDGVSVTMRPIVIHDQRRMVRKTFFLVDICRNDAFSSPSVTTW